MPVGGSTAFWTKADLCLELVANLARPFLHLCWVEITLGQLDLGFSEVLATILWNHKADFPGFACKLRGHCSALAR